MTDQPMTPHNYPIPDLPQVVAVQWTIIPVGPMYPFILLYKVN